MSICLMVYHHYECFPFYDLPLSANNAYQKGYFGNLMEKIISFPSLPNSKGSGLMTIPGYNVPFLNGLYNNLNHDYNDPIYELPSRKFNQRNSHKRRNKQKPDQMLSDMIQPEFLIRLGHSSLK
ncbi:unnamed protein product [Gordionus sp. m RMFG-2023]